MTKEGVKIEFKTKGSISQIEGVKFTKNGYSFSGSKVDKQFSYSKIDFALRQNSRVVQQPDNRVTPIQPQLPQQKNASADSESYGSGLGGLFDDLPTPNPVNDAEEAEFRRRMQRKKKNKRGFGL